MSFVVDAYDELFTGRIQEIRLSSTTLQNVVTYPVIVSAPNPDLKLLPGMTATISFQVDERNNVRKLPNTALRFYPEARYVRTEDQQILEGMASSQPSSTDDSNEGADSAATQSARDQAEMRKKRGYRHVWVAEGQKLRAIPVTTGLSDGKFTEIIEGEIPLGTDLVTGIEVRVPGQTR